MKKEDVIKKERKKEQMRKVERTRRERDQKPVVRNNENY